MKHLYFMHWPLETKKINFETCYYCFIILMSPPAVISLYYLQVVSILYIIYLIINKIGVKLLTLFFKRKNIFSSKFVTLKRHVFIKMLLHINAVFIVNSITNHYRYICYNLLRYYCYHNFLSVMSLHFEHGFQGKIGTYKTLHLVRASRSTEMVNHVDLG